MLRSSGARNVMECCVAAEPGTEWNPNPIKNIFYWIFIAILSPPIPVRESAPRHYRNCIV